MKTASRAKLIAVALMALSLCFVGCRKNPQKPTTLLGQGPGKHGITGDERGGIIGNVPAQPGPGSGINEATIPGNVGDPNQGLKAAVGDWEKWSSNRDEFKDQTVYFDYDKHNVKPSEVAKLKEVARRMKTFQGKALRIEGHCDERRTEEYNRSLGDRRAQAIREFLASEGFDPSMMPTITYGEDKPVDPGHSEAAYSKNRRGEMVLLSPTP